MKIYIGADHRGFQFKERIIEIVKSLGHEVVDMGAYTDQESCDYPKIAYKVAHRVVKSRKSRGILLCMSGMGQMIAANKVKGAYAALCHNTVCAALSREHNNTNILVLGSKFVKPKEVGSIVKTWLTTPFAGGRHLRRFNQIRKIENNKVLK